MRLGVAAVAICLGVVGVSAAQNAAAAMNRKPINIPAQPLSSALEALAKERDLQVIYRSDLVASVRTSGAVGVFTPEETLTKLLSGTGLTYRYLNETTVTITPASAAGASGAAPSQPSSTPPPTSSSQKEPANSGAFLLAQVASGQAASPASVESQQKHKESSEVPLQEVIVTAQKRTERLQDVPVPVTVLNADDLEQSNQLRFQDYYNRIPGVSLIQGFTQTPAISIRGIGMTGGNPTVGITIDDAPFGASAGLAGGLVPDIDPSDLARVEVLRGPQGTLYGASSMGGLIKFVTVDPSTENFSGRVEAGTSSVYNGAELGYNFRGSANLPLNETMALRISGFTRQDPGYVDNVLTGEKGVNEIKGDGGRLSFLWRPSEAFSMVPSALIQDFRSDGSSTINPAFGDLKQDTVNGGGGYHSRYEAYSIITKAKIGSAALTSVTGYNVNTNDYGADYTPFLGPFSLNGLGAFKGFGFADTVSVADRESKKFTQEIRLLQPIGDSIDWLLGAFYTDEHNTYVQTVFVSNPATGANVGNWVRLDIPNDYKEYAAFTDVTWKITDRFDIQIGGRESQNRQTQSQTSDGIYNTVLLGGPSTIVITNPVSSQENAFTFLATPRLRLTPETMIYARVASGYRPGGPNYNPSAIVPPKFDSDTTKNYEIGAKGTWLERALSYDFSIYDIEWDNIQLFLVPPATGAGFNANGGKARSRGMDLTLEVKPAQGLTVSAWVSFSDAKILSVPVGSQLGASPGDRLPLSSRFSGNLSVSQDFRLSDKVDGHLGADLAYVGDRKGDFGFGASGNLPRQDYPAYAQIDLRAGATLATWNLNLFANNVADKRGLIGGGLNTFLPDQFFFIQPRTIGLSLSKKF